MNAYKFSCPYCGEDRLVFTYYAAISWGAIHLENNHGDREQVQLDHHVSEVGVIEK